MSRLRNGVLVSREVGGEGGSHPMFRRGGSLELYIGGTPVGIGFYCIGCVVVVLTVRYTGLLNT